MNVSGSDILVCSKSEVPVKNYGPILKPDDKIKGSKTNEPTQELQEETPEE